MAIFDLGAVVAAEHRALNARHLEQTQVSTNLHVQADEAEEAGFTLHSDQLRFAADQVQTAANRQYRPRSN